MEPFSPKETCPYFLEDDANFASPGLEGESLFPLDRVTGVVLAVSNSQEVLLGEVEYAARILRSSNRHDCCVPFPMALGLDGEVKLCQSSCGWGGDTGSKEGL